MRRSNILGICGVILSAGLAACTDPGEPGEQPADGGVDGDGGLPDGGGDDAQPPPPPPPPPNGAPAAVDLALDVEAGGLVAGRLQATDPEGDPITFAVAGNPGQGTIVSFDPATGVFVYRPSSTASGTDSFKVTAADAAHPGGGQATVTVNIKAFSIFRPWVATNVTDNGSACSNTELTLTRTGNVVVISPRPYPCGSVTTTHGSLTLDVVGNKLYQQGQQVGDFTATSLSIARSTTLSGCGQIGYSLRIRPGAGGGYVLEDDFSWGTCPGSTSMRAELKRGAHLAILSDGAFGKLPYPGPHDRTIHLASDGELPATGLAGGALAAPFSFKGGAYPGTGGTCGATLASGSACSVVLAAGGAAGTFTGTLALSYSNGARTIAASLPLSVELWRYALLELTPGTAAFGPHELAALPASTTITVKNAGTIAATSIAATLTGSAAFAYKGGAYPGTGGTCGASLAGGATCTLELGFAATAKGAYKGSLALAYENGATSALATLPISGAAASFVGYGLYQPWGVYARDIVPYYDLGGFGAPLVRADARYAELAHDPASNTFFATNRHYLAHRITPAGGVTDITPGLSWPRAAAVDPTRNRLVIVGAGGHALRDLATSAWTVASGNNSNLETMKYRAADDTFVGIDLFDLDNLGSASGSLKVLSAATLAVTGTVPIDFSALKDVYFDDSGDRTHIVSAADKIFLVGQVPWWSTGAAAATGAFDTYKTAGYEIDRQTGKLRLAWEVPEDAVQPASATKLHGVSIFEGCSTPPCTVDVAVSTGAATVLVLNSLKAVTWRLAVSPGTTLTKVIVRSQTPSTVLNAGAATVDVQTSTLYAYKKGAAAAQLRYRFENLTQLGMSSLQLAYQQASFTVGP